MMARPQDPEVKDAVLAALRAACRDARLAAEDDGAALWNAWHCSLLAAFDTARPPGRVEAWARRAFPALASCIRAARLETTSPRRCDAIERSAVAIFEMRHRELRAPRG